MRSEETMLNLIIETAKKMLVGIGADFLHLMPTHPELSAETKFACPANKHRYLYNHAGYQRHRKNQRRDDSDLKN